MKRDSAHPQRSDGRTSVPCYQSDSQSVDRDRRAGLAAQKGPEEKVHSLMFSTKFTMGCVFGSLLTSFRVSSDSRYKDDHEGRVRGFPHHGVKHGGVCGAGRVRRVGHPLSQVTGAVQRVRVRPLFKRLLPVKEHQLKRHWQLLKRRKRREGNSSALYKKILHRRPVFGSAAKYNHNVGKLFKDDCCKEKEELESAIIFLFCSHRARANK